MANRFNYTVDDNDFTISIYDTEYPTETGAPNVRQPHKPWGGDDAWDSKEQAIEWAEQTIANLLNPPKPVKIIAPVEDSTKPVE